MVRIEDSPIIGNYLNSLGNSFKGVKNGSKDSSVSDFLELNGFNFGKSENLDGGDVLKSIVEDMLQRQGYTSLEAAKKDGSNFTIDNIARDEAADMLAPGGAWSPDAVSGRIVDFAIGAFGNDKEKIQEITDAINRGFDEARKAWGGDLPEITKETSAKIFEKLDLWVEGKYPPEAEGK